MKNELTNLWGPPRVEFNYTEISKGLNAIYEPLTIRFCRFRTAISCLTLEAFLQTSSEKIKLS